MHRMTTQSWCKNRQHHLQAEEYEKNKIPKNGAIETTLSTSRTQLGGHTDSSVAAALAEI
jgi:hypothetical protein